MLLAASSGFFDAAKFISLFECVSPSISLTSLPSHPPSTATATGITSIVFDLETAATNDAITTGGTWSTSGLSPVYGSKCHYATQESDFVRFDIDIPVAVRRQGSRKWRNRDNNQLRRTSPHLLPRTTTKFFSAAAPPSTVARSVIGEATPTVPTPTSSPCIQQASITLIRDYMPGHGNKTTEITLDMKTALDHPNGVLL